MQATLAIGAALGVTIAIIAFRFGVLNASGAIAAASLGALAVSAGWSWGIVLVAYFASSSALSRYRQADKERRTEDRLEKGGRRDALQVLANGGVYAIATIGYLARPHAAWLALGAGALAASAADTWATEVGTLAGREPRSILNGRTVPAGTSGGVTVLGLVAALAGAAFVALVALAVGWHRAAAVGALVGGFTGSLLDSLLGATVQSRRWCVTCRLATERKVHRCGATTSIVGGQRWLDNDGVNALSTLGGAIFAVLTAMADA